MLVREALLEAAKQQVEAGVEDLVPLQRRRVRGGLAEAGVGRGVGQRGGSAPAGVEVLVAPRAAAEERRVDQRDQALVPERRGATDTGGRPRESVVAANAVWVLDESSGGLTPIPLGG